MLGLIVIIAIIVILFLVFRAIVLWYWRVNEGIELLKNIDTKLAYLVAAARQAPGAPPIEVLRGAPAPSTSPPFSGSPRTS
jgi:hypothetical protein